MVARVEKTAQGYVIPVSEEMVKAMRLSEGTPVEISALDEQSSSGRTIRYATTEEVLRAFERTLPQHDAVYRELAK